MKYIVAPILAFTISLCLSFLFFKEQNHDNQINEIQQQLNIEG